MSSVNTTIKLYIFPKKYIFFNIISFEVKLCFYILRGVIAFGLLVKKNYLWECFYTLWYIYTVMIMIYLNTNIFLFLYVIILLGIYAEIIDDYAVYVLARVSEEN